VTNRLVGKPRTRRGSMLMQTRQNWRISQYARTNRESGCTTWTHGAGWSMVAALGR
jgi:hypothetical protein